MTLIMERKYAIKRIEMKLQELPNAAIAEIALYIDRNYVD